MVNQHEDDYQSPELVDEVEALLFVSTEFWKEVNLQTLFFMSNICKKELKFLLQIRE